MTWFGRVDAIKVHPYFGPYAFSRLTSSEYPIPVTTDCLYLKDYPPHVRSVMVPGWRFRWTITREIDRLDPSPGPP